MTHWANSDPARRPNVLVVDDDPNILHVIRGVLEDEAVHVQTASDGQQALALAERFPPDLIVLDVTLPALDSSAVAARLQDLAGGSVPILVITADGQAPRKAQRLGAYAYLRKPFDLDRLVSTVWRGLGVLPDTE